MQPELFAVDRPPEDLTARLIAPDVVLLPGRADVTEWLAFIVPLLRQAPWRHMQVPGGKSMSALMTNCGPWGWVTDTSGYRYSATDPRSGRPWPAMPTAMATYASNWAAEAGFTGPAGAAFEPDSCLINGYARGAKMGRHRDNNEADYDYPIVSVSLGASARFTVGGTARDAPVSGLMLGCGDVLVWGRSARLMHHGVGVPRPAPGQAPLLSDDEAVYRINLTFRRAADEDERPSH